MRTILHILTKPDDEVAAEIIALQKADATLKVEVMDLTAGQAQYEAAVQKVFEAESVQVW